MKMMRIPHCMDCPYLDYGYSLQNESTAMCDYYHDTCREPRVPLGAKYPVSRDFDIPSWCPLEDAPEDNG